MTVNWYPEDKMTFFVTIMELLRLAFVRDLEWYMQQPNNLV